MWASEAEARWKTEKEGLLSKWTALPLDDQRKLILDASEYRSGEDSCNSVYMGGMAQTMLRVALKGANKSLEDAVATADASLLAKGLDVCAPYIKHMQENPTMKCPCCDQIVSAEDFTWEELMDEIAEAIDNSIDMDWNSRIGAQAVIDMLKAKAGVT